MAFNDFETSRDQGQPVDLYLFTYGETVEIVSDVEVVTPLFFAYTDGETPVTLDGITYTPLPISRGSFESRGNIDMGEMTITVPRTSDISELLRFNAPTKIVSVKIRQGHIGGDDFPVAWLGRILEQNTDGAEGNLVCEAASVSMDRPGLRRHYQWPCPLVLYGPRCKANKQAATYAVTVLEVDGNSLRVSAPILPDNISIERFVGGYAEWVGENGKQYHSILRVDAGASLVFAAVIREIEEGQSVNIILGCAHTISDCEIVHQNIINYGGQPYIPTYNPVFKNNHT